MQMATRNEEYVYFRNISSEFRILLSKERNIQLECAHIISWTEYNITFIKHTYIHTYIHIYIPRIYKFVMATIGCGMS